MTIDRKLLKPGDWIEVRDPSRRVSYGVGGVGLYRVIKAGRVNVKTEITVRFSPTGAWYRQEHTIPLDHVARIVPASELKPEAEEHENSIKENRAMRFPSINDVSAELRRINKQNSTEDGGDEGIDVRLQVMPDSTWTVNWGLSDYDQDHRGYWGSSSVPGDNRRFDSKDIARDLIEQAREHKATGGNDDVSENPARGRVASRGVKEDKVLHSKPGNEFKDFLENNAILVAGDGDVIDLDDREPVRVAIIVNVTGYGPHTGAIYAMQRGNEEEALEAAHEILEEWERDHYPEADEDTRTETFDGRSWTLDPTEFADAIEHTSATKFIEISEDEEEEEDE